MFNKFSFESKSCVTWVFNKHDFVTRNFVTSLCLKNLSLKKDWIQFDPEPKGLRSSFVGINGFFQTDGKLIFFSFSWEVGYYLTKVNKQVAKPKTIIQIKLAVVRSLLKWK